MPVPAPFEAVGDHLLHEGIAPRHVKRYLRELRNHLDDYIEDEHRAGYDDEEAAARARDLMGDDITLTLAMLAQRKKFRSFTARMPFVVFVAVPVLLLASFFVAMGGVLALAAWMGIPGFYIDTSGKLFEAPDWYANLGLGMALFDNFVLPFLAASMVVLFAVRQRCDMELPVIGIVVTALLGTGLTATMNFPPSPAGKDWAVALVITLDMMETPLRLVLALSPLAALLFYKAREPEQFDLRQTAVTSIPHAEIGVPSLHR